MYLEYYVRDVRDNPFWYTNVSFCIPLAFGESNSHTEKSNCFLNVPYPQLLGTLCSNPIFIKTLFLRLLREVVFCFTRFCWFLSASENETLLDDFHTFSNFFTFEPIWNTIRWSHLISYMRNMWNSYFKTINIVML